MSFISELKRRNVIRMAGLYIVGAWLILQVSETILPIFDTPNWVLKLLVYALFVGFIPAMIVAWVFEMTPDGLKRDEDVVPEQSIAPQTARRMERLILALFAVALIFFAFDKFVLTPKREAALVSQTTQSVKAVAKTEAKLLSEKINPASIAVLAFADMSQDKSQGYFSDGISEEILNVLVKINKLQVSSRTSSFQFKDKGLGIPQIAKQLKVRHIVEGSVRKSGNNIRITAQLIDATNDKHLWSETYDRPLNVENIFAIQDEIAHSIVEALSETLGVMKLDDIAIKPSTDSLSAYDLFLKAKPLFLARLDLDRADEYLIQALELDPNYAQAWGMHAALQTLMYDYGYSKVSLEETEKNSIEFAQHALSIDANNATALAVLAKIRMNRLIDLREQYDIAQLIAEYSRALSIDPRNASTLNWRGLSYVFVGKLELALKDFEQCIAFEPYYEPCLINQVITVGILKGDQLAYKEYLKVTNLGAIKVELADLGLLARMDQELAFKTTTNHPRILHGWRRHDELYLAYKNPQQDHREIIADIRKFLESQPNVDKDQFRDILAELGDFDVLPYSGSQWQWNKRSKAYRQSKQFHNFIKKAGVFDYWKKKGFPPQCRTAGKEDFICD